MRRREIWAIGALAIVFVVIAAFVLTRTAPTGDIVSFEDIPRPAPPPGPCPIEGSLVSLEEARQRTPYTIPLPPEEVVGADLKIICVSLDRVAHELRMVYLIYANDLEMFISGLPERPDRRVLKDPTRKTNVRGIPAVGNDPYIKTFSDGHRTHIISSLSWRVNRVEFTLYHPTWLMDDLVRVGEAMSDPAWR